MRSVIIAAIALAVASAFATSVAAAPLPPLEAYGQLPAMENVAISPSGERLAFIKTAGSKRRLVTLSLPNKVLDIFEVGDNKVRGLRWAGENHVLLSISTTASFMGGDTPQEFSNVIVIDLATHSSHPLLFKATSKVQSFVEGSLGAREVDGKWYGYYFLPGDFEQVQLYKVDLDGGGIDLVYARTGRGIEMALDPKGQVVAHTSYDDATGEWLLFGRTEANRIASGKAALGVSVLDGLGRTPHSVLVGSRENADAGPLREIDIDSGKVTPLDIPDQGDLGFLRDPVSYTMIGYQVDGASPKTTLFDPALASEFAKVQRAFKGESIELASYSADFKRLVVRTEAGKDSGAYYLFDVPTHAVNEVGLFYPDIGPDAVGPTSVFNYKAQDGTPIEAILTLPPGRDPKGLPVVVMPHGGPEARDTLRFDWWAQAFANRGYAVLQPNFRGSSGYDVAFRDAGYGQWGRKMQTDVSDGLVALAATGMVDAKRACIVGWSYGGYASLAGVTVQNGLYRCAVAGGAVANLGTMLDYEDPSGSSTSGGMRRWKKFMGAARGAGDPALISISPARLAARADAPILLIHGLDDTVVPLTQAREMKASLDAAGKKVELLTLPGEDHWLTRPEGRVETVKASVAFVEKYNPSDAPHPVVTVQPAPAGGR